VKAWFSTIQSYFLLPQQKPQEPSKSKIFHCDSFHGFKLYFNVEDFITKNYPMIEAKPPAAIPMTALSANEGGLWGGA
jgi:hypothetical protein